MTEDQGWKAEESAEQSDRARQRAQERERREQERMEMAQARIERRTAERELASQERQDMREARRLEEAERLRRLRPAPTDDSPADIPPRRRKSGAAARTGEPRIERDTRHYRTVIDTDRIRELAQRGIPASGLATVFGISMEEIEAILAVQRT